MKQKQKGFTLVELLVVMGIIAALAYLGGANYITAQKRARNARRATDIQEIRSALEMYRTDKGYYPKMTNTGGCESSIGACTVDCLNVACIRSGSDWVSTAGGFKDLLEPDYINPVEKDILNNSTYKFEYYSYKKDGVSSCDNSLTNECMRYTLQYWTEPLTSGGFPTTVTESNP